MKIAEMSQKTDQELEELIATKRKRLAEIAIELRTKKVSNVKETMKVKKTIARALTIQRERYIEKEEAQDA